MSAVDIAVELAEIRAHVADIEAGALKRVAELEVETAQHKESLEAWKEAHDIISRSGYVDGLHAAIEKEAKRGASLANAAAEMRERAAQLAESEELAAQHGGRATAREIAAAIRALPEPG